jgi:hypothetical protein
MFDFRCSAGHQHEQLVGQGVHTVPCRQCNNPANRLIGTPTIGLEGWSMSFPTAADRWARKHEEAVKVARERNAE